MGLENILNQTTKFLKENNNFCILTAAAVVASGADLFMTVNYAENIQEEANPIMRYLWDNYGLLGMASAKLASISVLGYMSKKSGNNIYLKIPFVII